VEGSIAVAATITTREKIVKNKHTGSIHIIILYGMELSIQGKPLSQEINENKTVTV
jgi:hypothetical protein